MNTASLTTKLGPLTLNTPIIAASGTFGYGCEKLQSFYRKDFGAITTKTTTIKPRTGNPPPRIFETASGLLNSIGLENIGINAFIKDYLPLWNNIKDTLLFVSIGGDNISEYVTLSEMLNEHSRIDAIELNISCPNVKKGCMAIGGDPKNIQSLLKEIKSVTNKPCIVKLSPNFQNIIELAKCCQDYGADILSLVNCFLGMSINLETKQPRFANTFAGLSGPAIKPLALKIVYEVCNNVSIPVIGMGGIMNANDAKEFFIAGASAVSIGTANLINPKTVYNIVKELQKSVIMEESL